MKNTLFAFLISSLMLAPDTLSAQMQATRPGVFLSEDVLNIGLGNSDDLFDRRKKKKKKRNRFEAKHNTLAVGLVGGDPLGLGGRAVFRMGQVGLAADVAYNRIRDDEGDKLGALGFKTDFRFYTKDPLMKILRAYTFIGLTSHRARFNETTHQSVYLMDGGFGAGVKLFRLEIGAEAGVLIPAKDLDNYKPGLGAFLNASVAVWLF